MSLDFQQIATQIVGFLILLWLLRRYAWGQILSLLDQRRLDIATKFQKIEREKEEIARLQASYSAKMAEIEHQAKLRIEEAVVQGEHRAREIAEEARGEAQRILEKAKGDIDREVAAARFMLKEEIITLAISAAQQVVEQEMNAERDRAYLIERLDKVKGLK